MEDKLRLDGRVAVVTGAGRGLGRVAALSLARAGADVALLSRSASALAEVAREVEQLGRRAMALPTDVTNEEAVEEAAQAVMEDFRRVDVLVNNAGVAQVKPLLETEIGELRQVLDVNIVGAFLCARAFGGHMVAARSGRVINVASVAGLAGEPNLTGYCASKGALIAFTRSLALEWARHGITVNALAPGYFRTDMNAASLDDPEIGPKIVRQIPLHRTGQPDELGPAFVFLASEASSYMTGSVLVIDGGQTAR